jgi:hypothetical protein
MHTQYRIGTRRSHPNRERVISETAFIQAVSRIAPKESDGEETQNKLKLRTFDFGGCTPMYIHTTYVTLNKNMDKKINKAQ